MPLSNQNLIATIGIGIMAAIGTVLSFPSHCQQPIDILLHHETVEATLDNDYKERISNRTGTSYQVSYSFVVKGTEYRGNSAISSAPTKTMPVIYWTKSPGRNDIELTSQAWFDLVIFCIPTGALAACLFALWLHWRGILRNRKEQAHGQ
jgi:hypothetical protein